MLCFCSVQRSSKFALCVSLSGTMFFFTLVGLLFFTYYLICIVLWIALDSDVETFFKSLVGKKISE